MRTHSKEFISTYTSRVPVAKHSHILRELVTALPVNGGTDSTIQRFMETGGR